MKSLVKALKDSSSVMYTFFLLLKERGTTESITHEEIHMASGKIPVSSHTAAEFVAKLKEKTGDIERAFQRQREAAEVPWDQEHFEYLLSKWIVGSDKAFDEVENPEFRELLIYLRHLSTPLNIPGRNTIK
ncbi:hypothetical protein H0H92_005060 [Tricholoma furcatifolium]|nr:hypothetical protein H0H92_005060 [Tricholoma furcatifolium]